MKKKYLILFCLYIFFFGMDSTFGMTLSINGVNKCQRNDEITIYITLDRTKEEKEVSAVDGTFNFDSSIFTVVSSAGLINNWTELSNIKDNNIFSYANLEFNNLITSSNENIAKVILKVKENAKFGNTSLELNNPNATDEKGNEILLEGKSHIIRIVSNRNTLSNLETSVGKINFHKDTLKYDITVDNEVDKIKIDASLDDSLASFLENYGSREVNLAVGENIIEIKIKAENGEIQTYTLNIIRKAKEASDDTEAPGNNDNPNDNIKPDDGENKPNDDVKPDNSGNNGTTNETKPKPDPELQKSSNNYLSTLIPSKGAIVFNKAITEYVITIPYDVSEISFEAKTENPKATIKVDGNKNLKVGENEITITVTAEDGNIRKYKINVIKKEKDIVLSNNSNLKNLSIKGYNLDFNSNKYLYNIKIKDEEYLNITYIKDDDKSNVSIIGNENLEDGSIIKITVVAEDGTTSSYIINIEKSNTKILLIPIVILILVTLILIIYIITKKKKEKQKIN